MKRFPANSEFFLIVGKLSILSGNFQGFMDSSSLSINFPNLVEYFIWSGIFPSCLKRFEIVLKVSSLSGKFRENLKIFWIELNNFSYSGIILACPEPFQIVWGDCLQSFQFVWKVLSLSWKFTILQSGSFLAWFPDCLETLKGFWDFFRYLEFS